VTMSENRQFMAAMGEKIVTWSCEIEKYTTELCKAGTPVLTV
jgi:hypothetical protein